MKSVALAFILTVSSSAALAGVEFRNDSEIPLTVQTSIVERIEAQCPQTKDMKWQIQELHTGTHIDRVDQGLTDDYYMSRFEVDAKELDSNHSTRYLMNVESIVTHANNGTFTLVTILDGCK